VRLGFVERMIPVTSDPFAIGARETIDNLEPDILPIAAADISP
jgi:hypothetical protein